MTPGSLHWPFCLFATFCPNPTPFFCSQLRPHCLGKTSNSPGWISSPSLFCSSLVVILSWPLPCGVAIACSHVWFPLCPKTGQGPYLVWLRIPRTQDLEHNTWPVSIYWIKRNQVLSLLSCLPDRSNPKIKIPALQFLANGWLHTGWAPAQSTWPLILKTFWGKLWTPTSTSYELTARPCHFPVTIPTTWELNFSFKYNAAQA